MHKKIISRLRILFNNVHCANCSTIIKHQLHTYAFYLIAMFIYFQAAHQILQFITRYQHFTLFEKICFDSCFFFDKK
jgi:hypothetical protein